VIVLVSLVLIKLLVHLLTNTFAGYGIFRDELYYLACSHRLDLGYVDQPPLSIYILALNRLLLGDSLFALRLLPALAGALSVLFTGLIVRKIGGGTVAVTLACLSIIAAPIHLAMNTIYSMNSLDILLWTLAAYVLVLIVTKNRPIHWIMLGLVVGLGLLNKIAMIWFAAGLVVGVVLTKERRHFTSRWPYLAAVVAFLLFTPYIIWNAMHDVAHVEFIRNATSLKYASVTRADFAIGQLIIMSPATSPVWLAGLFLVLLSGAGKPFRILGVIYISVFAILFINGHSKPEYMAPAYPMVLAAGGVQLEALSRRRFWAWLKYALPAVIVIVGAAMAPMTLPFLPVKTYIRYAERAGMGPGSYEGKEVSQLHQFYADMFGWEHMAETVSKVYAALPEEERDRTVAWGANYGEAGALEYYSRKYELPPVISSHNSYWIWGYGSPHYRTVIFIGVEREDVAGSFDEVEEAGTIQCDYCMPYENNLTVFVCRGPKVAWDAVWDSVKHYE
jgi:hypothetical protein